MMTSSPGDRLDNSVGTNVSFICEASGVGLGRRWYRNGEEVSPSPGVEIRVSIMTIYGLLEGDSGMYQCSVSNGTSSVWRQWRVVVSSEYTMGAYLCMIVMNTVVSVSGTSLIVTVDIFTTSQVWSLYPSRSL